MLQLEKFYETCFKEFRETNEDCCPLKFFSYLEIKRNEFSRRNIFHFIDSLLWTEKRELIDEPGFDEKMKREIVLGLHMKNKVCGTYKTTIALLRPLIEDINKKEKRPARLLEIGSGSGRLSLALYDELAKTPLQFELTGSDVVPTYIHEAQREAAKKKVPVCFRRIDAFHLESLPENSYDILFCLHSLHHFTPAELSRILSGSSKVASRAFVGVDGYRGLLNLLFMAVSGAIKSLFSMNSCFLHDSLISGRKMYAARQLEYLSRLSCPQSFVTARNLRPGLTMVMVKHNVS